MEMITSAKNERIKFARSVREGREAELVFVEGERLVDDCLKAGVEIEAGFCVTELWERYAGRIGDALLEVSPEVMRSMSDTVTPQGIVALMRRPETKLDCLWETEGVPLVVALDRLQDPGNVGTLFRTSEAAGVTGIAVLEGTADPFSPKVLRSSMGSIVRVPLQVGLSGDDVVAEAKRRGLQVVAAAGEAQRSFRDVDWTRPTMLILGNEGRGVDPELLEACDVTIRIPMAGAVESLNVATAGAVLLFEAARQRESGV